MLEGQVAVLSSGYLDAAQSLVLLKSLRASAIYRSDQNSYMLYPDKEQVSILEKNVIPGRLVEDSEWIQKELETGGGGIVERDLEGGVHFNPQLRNAGDLTDLLVRRGNEDLVRDRARADLATVAGESHQLPFEAADHRPIVVDDRR